MYDLDALTDALKTLPGCAAVTRDDLEPLAVTGIAHDHIRVRGLEIGGRPALLRVPCLSQWGLEPDANLAYQRACFERAQPSGATPALLGMIPASPEVPMGALLVEAIDGRKPGLPDDMAAIARCLARIHACPVPPPAERPPLQIHENAVARTLSVIEEQAAYLTRLDIDAAARAAIDEELDWARDFARAAAENPPPVRLVATDAHPGNFLIDAGGDAILVDLEKMLYGAPAIDLAHASLQTSTMWDPDVAAALSPDEVSDFLDAYFAAVEPGLADEVRPWIWPMRRLTWLRTLTWCGRWRVLSREGADWSADRLDPVFRAHLERITQDFFSPDRIAEIRAAWLMFHTD